MDVPPSWKLSCVEDVAEPWLPVKVASLVQDSAEAHTVVEVYLPNRDVAQQ